MRDQIVLATKYTSPYRLHNKSEIQVNYVGNNAKSMKVSVDASLRKLKTDYIDLVSGLNRATLIPSYCLANHYSLVVRPLVGLQHLHRRSHDLAQPPCHGRQSTLSGH